eukprot:CCRYP_012113-RA/>CCRYP_012113-RA protein AED:0.04 eAED:0.04 QI:5/0.9/1/1/0.4/0.27/11/4736/114
MYDFHTFIMPCLSAIPKLRFLSAWFCPYAHRATIALEHHAGRVEYEWVEGWEQRRDENNVTGSGKEWWYHWVRSSTPFSFAPTACTAHWIVPPFPELRKQMNSRDAIRLPLSQL